MISVQVEFGCDIPAGGGKTTNLFLQCIYRDNMRMYVGVLYSWQDCAGQIGGKWGLLLTGSFVGAANDGKSGPNVAYLPTSP
jgi:hypothetical protein